MKQDYPIWHPFTQMGQVDHLPKVTKAKGVHIYDEAGNSYIDAISSWWVNLHGHSHPYINAKICAQMNAVEHIIFAGFTHEPAQEICRRLQTHLPSNQKKFFFSDNGSTANEIAIKMAIQFRYNRDGKLPERPILVSFDEAYHGDTFGAMATSERDVFVKPFVPMLFDVKTIPAPIPGKEESSLKALIKILSEDAPLAFIFEPLILGAAGMLMYDPEILDEMLAACKAHDCFSIADEVMTGFGRTGKTFAVNHLQQQPDMVTMSKGLTGGYLPMGLTSCTQEIYDAFYSSDLTRAFFHGHSFTGNPMGCAAALASLDLLEKDECQNAIAWLMEQHKRFGQEMRQHAIIAEVRQRGTVLAMLLKGENHGYLNPRGKEIYRMFVERGVLLRPLGNVFYILPPYSITPEELEQVYETVRDVLGVLQNEQTLNLEEV